MASQQSFEISPLGAAVVEALPDHKKVRTINRAFKDHGICPTSELFSAEEVTKFYKARGRDVRVVLRGVKG